MEIFGSSPEIVLVILIPVVWYILMRFVLPRLGVST
jgi:hypothetical protein